MGGVVEGEGGWRVQEKGFWGYCSYVMVAATTRRLLVAERKCMKDVMMI